MSPRLVTDGTIWRLVLKLVGSLTHSGLRGTQPGAVSS